MFGKVLDRSIETRIFRSYSDAAFDDIIRQMFCVKNLSKALDVKITADEDCIRVAAVAWALQPETFASRKVPAYFDGASLQKNLVVRHAFLVVHEYLNLKHLPVAVGNGLTLGFCWVAKAVFDSFLVGNTFRDADFFSLCKSLFAVFFADEGWAHLLDGSQKTTRELLLRFC